MAASSKLPLPKMELSFESWLQLHNLGLAEAEVVIQSLHLLLIQATTFLIVLERVELELLVELEMMEEILLS